ncbi:MAG: undecaprenyl-diphosphatase UppP [Candidatus Nealsonbacteria bacterium]|nr:undecaprenyl-diphosphatase UppP [Candidatus Nealsonbacteria bacterium]
MDYIYAAVAGFVQGVTEFLPISSSGHLIILEHFFGVSPERFGLAFDASIHLGTLFAVLLFFFKDYADLYRNRPLLVRLIIGTIPTVVFGLLFESIIESSFRQLWLVGVALIGFSFIMFFAEKYGKKMRNGSSITKKESLIIGLFQTIALIPGISRSGATMSAGLFIGVKRDEAAKFAFLLSGPIVAGAGLLKFNEAMNTYTIQGDTFLHFVIGIISACVFGFLTIKYFLKFISTHTLYPFIVYRIVIGVLLILISVIR